MEVQLPVATKAKIVREMLVQKEKGFIQMLSNLGEWQTLISKSTSTFRHGKSPCKGQARTCKAKTKASIQSSCSILMYSTLEPVRSHLWSLQTKWF